jgi:hypothetical protein
MKKDDDYIEETWTGTCGYCDGDGLGECPECEGEGEVDGEVCYYCKGEGYLECPECDGEGEATYHMGQVVK